MLAAFTRALRTHRLPAAFQAASFAKVAPKAKGKPPADLGAERGDSNSERLLELLQPKTAKPETLSPEESAEWNARAKEYSRRKMAQHRAWQKALSTKIKLKNAAILALPEELRAHAATEDLEPPPLSRRMPTLTPPIPDYKQQQQTSTTPGRRIGTKR